jgi:small subunit ribosomal protein S15
MHSRVKGKSRSKKPARAKKPEWVGLSAEEVFDAIEKLAREGNNASKIGLILRDQYGVPDVALVTKKKVTQILKEKNLAPENPEDLNNLIRKAVKLRAHLDSHKKDKANTRGLELMESKIKRLIKHYKASGRLPADYRYEPEQAKLEVVK